MAERIKAISAYVPRIILGKTAQLREVVAYIAERTGLNRGEIRLVLDELHDTALHFNRAGRAVKYPGLGIYTPSIGADGVFNIGHRLDRELKKRMNDEDTFTGDIANNDMIGKTTEELIARWDEEHPDDPVVV
jgi:hypothetical protein